MQEFLSAGGILQYEVIFVGSTKPLKISVSLSLDEEVVKKLRVLAEEDDRQLSSYINIILRNYLRGLETEKRDGP